LPYLLSEPCPAEVVIKDGAVVVPRTLGVRANDFLGYVIVGSNAVPHQGVYVKTVTRLCSGSGAFKPMLPIRCF